MTVHVVRDSSYPVPMEYVASRGVVQIRNVSDEIVHDYVPAAAQFQSCMNIPTDGVVRAISGLILGLRVEYVIGDALLAKHLKELPDPIPDLLLNGLTEEHAT